MKYPRLRPEDDLRKKLLPADIKQIRAFRSEGLPLRTIAERFNVSQALIVYWTDSTRRETVRRQAAKRRKIHNYKREAERTRERYWSDPKYRMYCIKQTLKSYHEKT